jgi:hypothetical protein
MFPLDCAITMKFFNPGCVAAPLGDFGKLLQAAPAKTTSNIPRPPPIPFGFGPTAGMLAAQNEFTTIANCVVPFPVRITEPGWIEHVTDGSVGSEHVSVTVGSSLSSHH